MLKHNSLKKSVASVVIIVMLSLSIITSVYADETLPHDATYDWLLNNILNTITTNETSSDSNILVLKNATVWKVNDYLSGFMFEGDDWIVNGEALTSNGLIYKISARLPYQKGLMMTFLIGYTLSEENDWNTFVDKYTSTDSILNNKNFTNYINTLDAGNSEIMIYEFTRTNGFKLNNENNLFDISKTVSVMQK